MKSKLLFAIVLASILGFSSLAYAVDVIPFTSKQEGTSPQNGYYLQTNGTVSTWAAVVGGGGGGGGGTWATTTCASVLCNYPLNTTDVVLIGGTSTTSPNTEWWFDPTTKEWMVETGSTTFNGGTFKVPGASTLGTATIGTLTLTNALTVPNGGSGATTLTGLISGNGASAFTATANGTNGFVLAMSAGIPTWVATSSINNGVTSIATNNGLTGGTITTTGTIGLATITAGVLGAVKNGDVPTSQATSTLYGVGTNGYVLAEVGGIPTWTATTTLSTISGTLAITSGGTGVTSLTANQILYTTNAGTTVVTAASSTLLGVGTLGQVWGYTSSGGQWVATSSTPGSGGSSSDPFTHVSVWGQTTSATSTLIALTGTPYSLVASSTAALSAIQVGSSTATAFTNNPLLIVGNVNSFTQAVVQNLNSGTVASADYVLGNDKMTNTTYYADLGYNSSGNTDSSYTGFSANSAYLYNNDGELDFATASTTAGSVIKFFTGGTLTANERARFDVNGKFGIGTSSPYALFSMNAPGSMASYFAIGSSTGEVFNLKPSANSSILLGTTTPIAANTSATSTFYAEKLQWQGSDSAGVLRCAFINAAGTFVVQAGPCL